MNLEVARITTTTLDFRVGRYKLITLFDLRSIIAAADEQGLPTNAVVFVDGVGVSRLTIKTERETA